MEQVTRFVAADGKEFDSREQCLAYEQVIEFKAAIGMTPSDIQEVLSGCQRELGDVIEKLAGRIAKKRLEMGGSKRVRKPIAEHGP